MNTIEFLTEKEGLQQPLAFLIVGIIAGTWAIIKQFHDFKLRKREQTYTLLMNQRAKAIESYIDSFVVYRDALRQTVDVLFLEHNPFNRHVDGIILQNTANKFSTSLNVLRFYFSENDMGPYKQMNTLLNDAHQLIAEAIVLEDINPLLPVPEAKIKHANACGSIVKCWKELDLAADIFRSKFFNETNSVKDNLPKPQQQHIP